MATTQVDIKKKIAAGALATGRPLALSAWRRIFTTSATATHITSVITASKTVEGN